MNFIFVCGYKTGKKKNNTRDLYIHLKRAIIHDQNSQITLEYKSNNGKNSVITLMRCVGAWGRNIKGESEYII